MFLINLIKRKCMELMAKYYENKQKEFMEDIMPRLKAKQYTLDKEAAYRFNQYECYKQLLRGGYWKIWRTQVKHDKEKYISSKRLSSFNERNAGR